MPNADRMTATADMTGDAVRLVLGISRLGEHDLRGWWSGHAMDRTGEYVLSNTFRRTWRSAALQLDVSAATRVHEELLGRSTALHFFSDLLPFRHWANGWLAEQKTAESAADADLLTELQTWSSDQAVSTLLDWCSHLGPLPAEALGSGILLGRLSSEDIADPDRLLQTARELCRSYLDQTGPLRPPYFDLGR